MSPQRNESSYALIDKVRKAGDYTNFVRNHRRVLSGIVSKCGCSRTGRAFRTDAAGHVVDFWCPPGGH